MAVVMILELPLVLLPCKSQVWGFMAAATGEERRDFSPTLQAEIMLIAGLRVELSSNGLSL